MRLAGGTSGGRREWWLGVVGGTSGGRREWWLGETSWRNLWREEGVVAR